MATAEAETSRDERVPPGGLVYDGFISYSHAADDLLAPRLQAGLQRFAKPWWKRRALRIFRDESSLSANPHLWSSITDALDQSGWFVLLLSPEAAESPWVNNEVEYWLANKDADRIIPVLTDGDFTWFDNDFISDAAPPALQGAFSDEPRWVDLRFARTEEQLDLKNPRFSAAIADVASAIRGVPKDELESEEVRQHRRTTRTAWAAGAGLLVLALIAGAAAIFALDQRNEAEQLAESEAIAREEADANATEAEENAHEAQRNAALAEARELAASAIGVVDDDPELATLLALEAITSAPEGAAQPVEVINALWEATAGNRLLQVIEPGLLTINTDIATSISADGSLLFVSGVEAAVLIDVASGQTLWEYELGTEDEIRSTVLSPDGALVAVPIAEPDARFSASRDAEPDLRPARVVILDGTTGEEVTVLEFPECRQTEIPAWSTDSSRLMVNSGPQECFRQGSPSGFWVEVFDTTSWQSLALIDAPEPEYRFGPIGSFDDSGRLFVFGSRPTEIYDAEDYSFVTALPETFGFGDVTPDGTRVLSSLFDHPEIQVHGVEPAQLLDVLPIDFYPDFPKQSVFSSEGNFIAVSVRGSYVVVWGAGRGQELFRVDGASPILHEATGRLFTTVGDKIMIWSLDAGTAGREVLGDLGTATWVNGTPFVYGDETGAFINGEADFSGFYLRFFDLETGVLLDHIVSDPESGHVWLPGDRFAYAPDPWSYIAVDPRTGEEELFLGCEADPEGICPDTGEPATDFVLVSSLDQSELVAIEIVFDEEGNWIGWGSWTFVDPLTGDLLGEEVREATNFKTDTFSEDWVLASDDQSDVVVTDRETGEVLWSVPIAVVKIEISSSRERLVIIGNDSRVTVVEPDSWDTQTIEFGFGNVRAASLGPGDRFIAIGDENALSIVDLAASEIVQVVPIGGVSGVHWFDEETILIGTNDGLWARISLDVNDLVARTRASITRTFTPQECLTYRIDPCPTLDGMRGV